MTTAVILINVEQPKNIKSSIAALGEIPGVTEVYTVAGEYDIVAIMRVSSNAKLSELITDNVHSIKTIKHTKTLIAMDVTSKFNLEELYCVK